jgi:hypothetical protein
MHNPLPLALTLLVPVYQESVPGKTNSSSKPKQGTTITVKINTGPANMTPWGTSLHWYHKIPMYQGSSQILLEQPSNSQIRTKAQVLVNRQVKSQRPARDRKKIVLIVTTNQNPRNKQVTRQYTSRHKNNTESQHQLSQPQGSQQHPKRIQTSQPQVTMHLITITQQQP